jgi:hypothetical protein
MEHRKLRKRLLPFPQFAQLQTVTCVQLGLITVLGNCGCVVFASTLGLPSALEHRPRCSALDISLLLVHADLVRLVFDWVDSDYTASLPRILLSSQFPLWEPQVTSIRPTTRQGNWQPQRSRNFRVKSSISSRQLVSRLAGAHWGNFWTNTIPLLDVLSLYIVYYNQFLSSVPFKWGSTFIISSVPFRSKLTLTGSYPVLVEEISYDKMWMFHSILWQPASHFLYLPRAHPLNSELQS